MGLSGSMWSSVSGLLTHGERMSVVSNQIANVNTVGFKGARMDFADFMSSYVGTSAGVGQVGRGVRAGIVMNDFSQGSFETTTSSTDVAISGNGFFKVRPTNSTMSYYTRAGNFQFDQNGFLVDPNGYALQGWKIDQSTTQASSQGAVSVSSSGIVGNGIPTDIRLETFTCPPRHTNSMMLAVNLDSSQGNDKCQNEDNPFFSLLTTWDATKTDANGNIVPLPDNARAYAHPIEVFDEGGRSHTLTIYYDRVEQTVLNEITGMEESSIVWEYIVTMDPSEERRDFDGDGDTIRGSKHAGLLMAGTMNFNSGGQLEDMTAYVPNGSTDSDMGDLSTWVQAPISASGYPMLCPNFSGRAGASTAWENTGAGSVTNPTKINANADGFLIEMNLGIRSTTNRWTGNAPATAAEWVNTSAITQAPMTSTRPAGTVLIDVQGSGNHGVVGEDGIVYHLKTAPGDTANNEVEVDGFVFQQKQDGVDSLEPGEIVGADGFIYAQKTIFDSSNNPYQLYQLVTSAGTTFYATDGTNTYRFADTEPQEITDADRPFPNLTIPPTARPMEGEPIASVRGVPSETEVLVFSGAKLLKSNKSEGTILQNIGAGNAQHGIVSTDGLVHELKTGTAGANEVVSKSVPHIVYEQKREGTDSIGTHEAAHNGFIYEQLTISDGDNDYYVYVDDSNDPPKWFASNGTNTFEYDAKPTSVDPANDTQFSGSLPSGARPAANPEKPAASTRPVTTGNMILRYDNNGNPIPLTVSNNYNGMGASGERQSTSTTSYTTNSAGNNFYEHAKFQDGYTYGDLRTINIDTDGVMTGQYSNGVTLQLFQITLYDFPSTQNLHREGNNLFSETRESGMPTSGAPGSGVFGTTDSYSLEGSNVDLSRELVNMITTQRGFQANSKSITTVDTMLETVIGMKR